MVRLASLLPIGYAAVEARPASHLSRPVQQRVLRRSHCDKSVNDCFDAINWSGGCSSMPATKSPSAEQILCATDVRARVTARLSEERTFSESTDEAVSALLKNKPSVHVDAECSVGGMATFDFGRISLPEHVHSCPRLSDVLQGEALKAVEGFETSIFNSVDEQQRVDAACDVRPRLYMDPVLAARPKQYRKLIKEMHNRGLIRYTRSPRHHVTMFLCIRKVSDFE